MKTLYKKIGGKTGIIDLSPPSPFNEEGWKHFKVVVKFKNVFSYKNLDELVAQVQEIPELTMNGASLRIIDYQFSNRKLRLDYAIKGTKVKELQHLLKERLEKLKITEMNPFTERVFL